MGRLINKLQAAENKKGRAAAPKRGKAKSANILDRIEDCEEHGQFDLDVSHVGLAQWPEELMILGRVKEILAHGNKLTVVPNLALTFKNLEVLDLSRNLLEDLDKMVFSSFTFMKVLNLSRNKLLRLPKDLGKMPMLVELNVAKNRLSDFPEKMGELKQLRVLDASYNNFEVIGDRLEYIPNLEDLNLSSNPKLNTGLLYMGTRTRRLLEKRALMASKAERRALITRALGVQHASLVREQNVVYDQQETNDRTVP